MGRGVHRGGRGCIEGGGGCIEGGGEGDACAGGA